MKIKRILIAAVSAAAICCTSAFSASAEKLAGDIDGDGKVTASDATSLLRIYTELSAGKCEKDPDRLEMLDIDKSGKLEAADASLILKYYSDVAMGYNGDMSAYLKYLENGSSGKNVNPAPVERVELDVENYCQYPDYPTGCESASLYMLLRFYGVDVTMEQIVDAIPKGSIPYYSNGKMYGADPEKEFVGDPRDENSYGVFNEPVAQTAELFKAGVKTKKGAGFTELINLLNSGNPVMAWFSYDTEKGITYQTSWIDPQTGNTIRWPKGEHAIVVCGHDSSNIFYCDPMTGTTKTVNNSLFLKIFKQMGSRIVYYTE